MAVDPRVKDARDQVRAERLQGKLEEITGEDLDDLRREVEEAGQAQVMVFEGRDGDTRTLRFPGGESVTVVTAQAWNRHKEQQREAARKGAQLWRRFLAQLKKAYKTQADAIAELQSMSNRQDSLGTAYNDTHAQLETYRNDFGQLAKLASMAEVYIRLVNLSDTEQQPATQRLVDAVDDIVLETPELRHLKPIIKALVVAWNYYDPEVGLLSVIQSDAASSTSSTSTGPTPS